MMGAAGGDPKTFTYNRSFGETNGVPRVIEFVFSIHRDGLTAGRAPSRKVITGVNWSPGINNPFRQLGRDGVGLDAILAEVRANNSQPVIAVLHLACPRVMYTDRGKSAIVVEGAVQGIDFTPRRVATVELPTISAQLREQMLILRRRTLLNSGVFAVRRLRGQLAMARRGRRPMLNSPAALPCASHQ
jgi:hypothetical protein